MPTIGSFGRSAQHIVLSGISGPDYRDAFVLHAATPAENHLLRDPKRTVLAREGCDFHYLIDILRWPQFNGDGFCRIESNVRVG